MDKQQIRAEILFQVHEYVVISDGGSRYLMLREDLGGANEATLKAMNGDQYQAWCDDHTADQRYANVCSGDNTEICNAMLDADCEYWCIG